MTPHPWAYTLLAVALSAVPLPAHAAPQGGGPVQDSASCLALTEQKPSAAVPAARSWLENGGSDAARHCLAQALFLNGDFAGAGQLFEDLAAIPNQSIRQRGSLLGRAGWSWLRAGDGARAEKLYSHALEALPGDGDLRLDRALARAETKRWKDVVDDLSLVLKQDSHRTDVLLLRASAYRQSGDAAKAREDADRTLKLRPGDAEALVLRGTLRGEAGDAAGAKADWEEATRRDPSGPSGRAAQANLKRLAPGKR